MLTENTSQNEKDKVIQIRKDFKRISDEAVNLRVTEKILSEVESRLLKVSPLPFEIESVKTALKNLKSFSTDLNNEGYLKAEFQINQKIRLWRGTLEERDEKIETFHLRRFFDFTEEPLDAAFFVALAQFYRNISNLSKFDLVVTRIFARGRGQIQREVRLNRREMTAYLRDFFNEWDGEETYTNQFSDETLTAVLKLEEFIKEAEFIKSFEELSHSDLFERLRTYKSELGKQFFEPAIAAAAVECNLAVGNVFNELMAKANQNLSARLTAKYDFASAFQDISPNAQTRISEILQEFSGDENVEKQDPQTDELAHLLELLEFGDENKRTEAETEVKPEETVELVLPTAQERLASVLLTLSEAQPDLKLLRDYMQKSNSLKMLDLSDFIHNSEEYFDRLCREVLSVILLADELCEHELTQRKELSKTTKAEVLSLVQKAQDFGKQMENLLEISDQSLQNRLLTVSNKLLETRLKLERNIVRFSNRNLGRVKETQIVTLAPVIKNSATTMGKPRANRWLIAATFLVAIICGGFYFFATQLNGAIPSPKDVEEIKVTELPLGDHLQIAHRQGSTLFVSAKNSWENLTADEKQTNLQNLRNFPTKVKVSTVIVINSEGKPLGDISSEGINLGENLTD